MANTMDTPKVRQTEIHFIQQGAVIVNAAFVNYASPGAVCIHVDTKNKCPQPAGVMSHGDETTPPEFWIDPDDATDTSKATIISFPEFAEYQRCFVFGHHDRYSLGIVLLK